MSKPLIIRSAIQSAMLKVYAKDNQLPEDIYENFVSYAEHMVPSWGREKLPWEWFHYYICKNLQRLIDGKDLNYLSIESAPQIGKSVFMALFITYVLGINPDKNILYFTYSEVAAQKFTKDYIFGFMGSEKYKKVFPFVVLKNDLNQIEYSAKSVMKKKRATLKDNEFNVINPLQGDKEYQGRYTALGLGQGSHGKAGDLILVDDFVAKASDIESELFREKMRSSFDSDIIARFQASTILLLISTRWFEKDYIGLLEEKIPTLIDGFSDEYEKAPVYESLKLRTEYRTSDNNPIEDPRTKDGEFLWGAMKAKYLLAKGGKNYNAIYNCDISDIELQNQLKQSDFGYYSSEELPKYGRIYISMDGASTTRATSDHTAIGAWMVSGRKRYLLRLWYVKMTIPNLQRLMEQILTVDYPDYSMCLIEYANSGVPVSQYLKEKFIRNTPLGFSGNEITDNNQIKKSKFDVSSKSNSKMDRYLRMIPEITHAEKRLLLPEYPIQYQDVFIKQLTTFNNDKHAEDDMVDMCSYLMNYTSKNTIIVSNYKNNQPSLVAKSSPMNYNLQNANYFVRR